MPWNVDQFNATMGELNTDINEASDRLREDDSPFNRRVYVRTTFAWIEAFSHQLRSAALELLTSETGESKSVDFATVALLQEARWTVGDTGKVKRQQRKLAFTPNIAFTLREFASALDVKADFFGEDGWNKLKHALKVRHRLTHPKTESDLQVSVDDLELARDGREWLMKLVLRIRAAHERSMKSAQRVRIDTLYSPPLIKSQTDEAG